MASVFTVRFIAWISTNAHNRDSVGFAVHATLTMPLSAADFRRSQMPFELPCTCLPSHYLLPVQRPSIHMIDNEGAHGMMSHLLLVSNLLMIITNDVEQHRLSATLSEFAWQNLFDEKATLGLLYLPQGRRSRRVAALQLFELRSQDIDLPRTGGTHASTSPQASKCWIAVMQYKRGSHHSIHSTCAYSMPEYPLHVWNEPREQSLFAGSFRHESRLKPQGCWPQSREVTTCCIHKRKYEIGRHTLRMCNAESDSPPARHRKTLIPRFCRTFERSL